MTEDYKQKILDWLTGNYNIESGNDVPEFIENNIQATTIIEELNNKFPYGFHQKGYVLCKNNTNELNGYILVYGYYYANANQQTAKGYLMLLDSEFNLSEIITQYDSGTDFRIFQILNVDEVGQIYGIDTYNLTTDNKRFIMLNNVSSKLPSSENYSVKLRQSYNLQGTIVNATVFDFIRKSETSAKYLLVGTQISSAPNFYKPRITELTINVGSTNDWIDYTYSGFNVDMLDLFAYWDNNNELHMTIYYTDVNTTNIIRKLTISSGTTLISTNVVENVVNYYFQNSLASKNIKKILVKVISENKFYFTILGTLGPVIAVAGIQTNLYNNGTITEVFEYTDYEYIFDSSDISVLGQMYELNNTYFLQFYYNTNTSAYSSTYTYNSVIAFITEEFTNSYTILASTTKYALNTFNLLIINNQFNLYNINYLSVDYELGDVLATTKLIYNVNNYNGQPYQALNSLVSNSVNLYDSNDEIIFARNLYDRIISSNITTSIVEIPNYSLNDINIQYQKLLSQTNNIIVNNNNLLVKNMYEEVLLDFIDIITMQNQNNPDNIINNLNGAIRVNNSISNPSVLDYSDAKMTKYKINYEDETSEINELYWYKVSNFYRCKISIYNNSSNPITNIELITQDEDTIYQTIDCSTLDTNKIYTISQDVYINEKTEPQAVYYNNNELYYGEQQVYY